ncbi:MAG: hypothetical protein HC871_16045 [Rhizobiales bacterium]|nr:hypothetical protein [Hyphomicrobiales bacterium]
MSDDVVAWGGLVLNLIFAFEARDIYRASLERRDYVLKGVVSGRSLDECERRFLAEWLPVAIRERDRMVFAWARREGLPLAWTLAQLARDHDAPLLAVMRDNVLINTHMLLAARDAGLGRTEVANWPMAAICRQALLDPDGMVAEGQKAVALARDVGQARAELIGLHAQMVGYMEAGRPGEAIAHFERSQDIVRDLGAFRFEPENLAFLADARFALGERELACSHAEKAVEKLGDQATLAYVGPVVLAIAALVESDGDRADGHLARAESVLAKGGVAHNHLWLRRYAIDIGWARRSADMIESHQAALAAYCSAESMPLTDFLMERARVLAGFIRGVRSQAWRDRLAALRAIAHERHLVRLDRALAEAGSLASSE